MKNNDDKSFFSLGISALEKEDYLSAESWFRKTLNIVPESLETLLNLGYVLDKQGRAEEALHCYESVLIISPQNPKARYNRSILLLRAGNLLTGFADYEARFLAIHSADSRNYAQPRWDGSSLEGRSILVYCEQGLGDAIQFIRFIPFVVKLGGRVVLEVQQPLLSLLSKSPGVERVVAKSAVPPMTDCHIPLLSLPHIFATTLDTLPATIPYLTPDPAKVNLWNHILAEDTQIRIGLVWRGSHSNPMDRDRSCPLCELAALLAFSGVSFYNLQVGCTGNEIMHLPQTIRPINLTEHLDDFSDTAALVANLDLIITVDTAVAHLAGALGKTVWVLLAHRADWRWMVGRTDSPWYPAMRLFRQPQAGDWASVVEQVISELTALVTQKSSIEKSAQDSDENLFQTALQALAEGDTARAINLLTVLSEHISDDPSIWFNLGRAYDESKQSAEASACYTKALQLKPDSPAILFSFGKMHLQLQQCTEAKTLLRKAHELMPESIDILLQFGAALVQLNETNAAFDCCTKMLAIDPTSVIARYNLAYLQLRSGDYLSGFSNFEARLLMENFKALSRNYLQPCWDGSPLNGRTILVFGEQGMGDVIQFARYLPMVAARGGKITLEIDPPLIPLFETFPGLAQVVRKAAAPPVTDVYIHLLSLPHIFGTTRETVPNRIPYIIPDPQKVAEWRTILADEPAFRVGLVWRGSPNNPIDRERSCSLSLFTPLTVISGIRFFSLQVGAGTEEIICTNFPLTDHTDRLKDMSDTAACIANLDLVIGVDTAVTHLAGAVGKPVWVILPHVYDWRWIVGRDESPWYPTARIFWQQSHGDWAEAIVRVKAALEQKLSERKDDHGFEDIEMLYSQGGKLKETGELEGAERCFRRIVELDPSLPDPHQSLGVVLSLQGRIMEAIEQYRNAIAMDPFFVKAHYNLANSLLLCGFYQEAIESARETIRCDSSHASAHLLLGMLLLQQRDFQAGWREYEWRWKTPNFLSEAPHLDRTQWDGSSLEGRTLLIHAEQGRGDTIQFIRFATLVAATGGKIIVSAPEELISLLRSVEGVGLVVSQTDTLPDFDVQIPLLSLPHLLKTTLETIPAKTPYLHPMQEKIEARRQSFAADRHFRVGLVWQGSTIHRDDHNRSCPLSEFFILTELAGVDYYCLQLGSGKEQLHNLPGTMKITDLSDRITDFSDTAAIILNLDLVISVDTAVAHLAGALGKPVWTLLPFVADWRWLLDTEQSPWYPTMRLFRQNSPGDWHTVISGVRHELSHVLESRIDLNQQGIELMNSGLIADAERAFAQMIVSNPHDAEAHCNRGVALDALQKYEEAIECYRSALSLKPDFIQPLFNMGNACLSLGNLDGAGACYERVLQFTPNFVQAHLRLGDIAKTGREYASAHVHYQNAFFLDPSCVDALQGIAEIYLAEEKFDDAITAYKKVVTSAPERSDAWNMLGTAYHSIERHADAEACYRKALALLPESVTICNNLGVELNDQGRLAEAISVYRHLLEVDTNYADGHWNLAVALLTTGNYSEGWREYEWRFKKSGPVPDRDFVQPRWDGSPLKGRTILLHAEQGFGDTIQLARYVPLVVERGGNVILECQVPALKRLLTSLNGITEVVVAGDPLPQFHCHLPLMSLPLIFETTMATIPRDIPYLAAQVEDIEEWQKRLGAPGSFRVGLVWSGRQSQLLNRKRSCPLENFAPLATIPNIDFYSLQVGDAFVQLNTGDPDFRLIDLTANIDDFSDTAAFIANLDLVITIDTAVAHLAGAVGAQTWVLLPHGADWRWQCDRADSPWYPTIRLFRQTSPGDWPSLINIVTAALHGSVNGKNRIPDIFPSSVFGNRRYA